MDHPIPTDNRLLADVRHLINTGSVPISSAHVGLSMSFTFLRKVIKVIGFDL